MNIMALAHKLTRDALSCTGCKGLSYKSLFRAAMLDLHRHKKAGHDISKISI